ncbi:hypothetical protein BAL199_04564 [alpha proteobacterium BAL199]|nr:hypothetical protein BAL199_04564 [alpha proteobacterium BAL199]
MLSLARFLFANGHLPLVEEVLRMALAVASADHRVVLLLVKLLADQGRYDQAITTGDGWIIRHGLSSELLEILTRCHVARGDAGIVTAAVRTMVAAPDRCEAYQQLAAAPEQRAGGQSGLRALHWLTPWFVTDDPRASVVLHKAYGVGPTAFERHAARLAASRPDLLWAPYYRAMIVQCVDNRPPGSDDRQALAGECAPRFRLASVDCVAEWINPAMRAFQTRRDLFAHCVSTLHGTRLGQAGLYLEFGVAKGASAIQIAALVDGPVHAFDSFQGLPESWEDEAAGSYSTGGTVPDLPENVQVHVGWFSETIPPFRRENNGPIAFLHIDCDLYSSTVDIFSGLGDRLTDGSVVVFDEYFGYPGFENHEMRAFDEFRRDAGWRATAIAIGPFTKQLAFRLHR